MSVGLPLLLSSIAIARPALPALSVLPEVVASVDPAIRRGVSLRLISLDAGSAAVRRACGASVIRRRHQDGLVRQPRLEAAAPARCAAVHAAASPGDAVLARRPCDFGRQGPVSVTRANQWATTAERPYGEPEGAGERAGGRDRAPAADGPEAGGECGS